MKPVVSAILVVLAAPAWAQAQRTPAVVDKTAAALGRGWTAIAQGQPLKAVEVSRQVLEGEPANHDAASLAVAAYAAGRRAADALNAYERWWEAAAHEDIFMLRTVAAAVLRALATSAQPRVRVLALSALAQAGNEDARSTLAADAAALNPAFEVNTALAALGDDEAIRRLEAQITGGGSRDKSAAIDALAAAGSKASAAAIASALKDPAPPARLAAANALADLGATEAVPALRAALADPDPAVRQMVAVALARFGDPAAGVTLQSLEASPLGELRLLAASAAAEQSPGGAWTAVASPLLQDADPIVRLRAAALLLKHGREREPAEAVLTAALADPSPALRTHAAAVIVELGRSTAAAANVSTLRRMLRDPLAEVQVAAARGLLRAPPAERR